MNKRILYFEGAGCDGTQRNDMENCRIRTAFKNKEGKRIYLEMTSHEIWSGKKKDKRYPQFENVVGFVDHCFEIVDEDGEDCNKYRIGIERNIEVEYCKSEILQMINKYLNCDFDELVILPRIAGYYVHSDFSGYNLMDDYVYDEARIAQSIKILNYFKDFERFVFCKEYPIVSCYWEKGKFNVWFSYYEFNDKFVIDDIFNYSFDYKIPPEDFLAKQRVCADYGRIKDSSTYADAIKRQEEFYKTR